MVLKAVSLTKGAGGLSQLDSQIQKRKQRTKRIDSSIRRITSI